MAEQREKELKDETVEIMQLKEQTEKKSENINISQQSLNRHTFSLRRRGEKEKNFEKIHGQNFLKYEKR